MGFFFFINNIKENVFFFFFASRRRHTRFDCDWSSDVCYSDLGAVTIAPGMNAVVRRRVTGPQYAITHTREIEYMVVVKGSGTIVTGGTLIPPTIDSDIYPNPDPNATIRSLSGVKGGLVRKIGVGDVIVNPPGTPHWLSEIEGAIEYVEIRAPNVDPAPGIERAEIAPGKAK